ncbi:hypothetical protein BG000_011105, partial [Podila horticola]
MPRRPFPPSLAEANCTNIVEANYTVDCNVDSDDSDVLYDEPLGLDDLADWICLCPALRAISTENIRYSDFTAQELDRFLNFLDTQSRATYMDSTPA